MLNIPEYLAFSSADGAPDKVLVQVKFDDPVARMAMRYVEYDLLNSMILAVSQGRLRFLSFDEHPKRIKGISFSASEHRAVIIAQVISEEDNFPSDWQSVPLEEVSLTAQELTQYPDMVAPAKSSRLRVGTLSSEIIGGPSGLSGPERVEAIVTALQEHHPDVLLVAGYALETEADLGALGEFLRTAQWDGLLFAEVRHYDVAASRWVSIGEPLSAHCLFAWTQDTGWKQLGRQYFEQSTQARAQKATRVAAFEENLPERVIVFRGRRFGALICGEINAMQGRNVVNALSPRIEDWLRGLDVIVNPTHDLMGNGGTLKAKRSWASQGGRVYLSASNWNSRKEVGSGAATKIRRQTRTAGTLHTVFIDGIEFSQACYPHATFEYREVCI